MKTSKLINSSLNSFDGCEMEPEPAERPQEQACPKGGTANIMILIDYRYCMTLYDIDIIAEYTVYFF